MHSSALLVPVSLLLLAACASSPDLTAPWVEFSNQGYVVTEGQFSGAITRGGKVTLRIMGSEELYVAYLSRQQVGRLQETIAEMIEDHGDFIDRMVATDDPDYKMFVKDPSGNRIFGVILAAGETCSMLDNDSAAVAAAELWNIIIRMLESPHLRTGDALIDCT